MKEYCRKFSVEEDDRTAEGRKDEHDPSKPGPPVFQDLRFVVKESVNLGFRVLDEIGRMLKKLEE